MELVPNMQENPNHNDNNNNGGISSATRRYFASIPPGYRFRPTDEELIVYYLLKKINNQPLPLNLINQCNVYEKNPQQLAGTYVNLIYIYTRSIYILLFLLLFIRFLAILFTLYI